MVSSLRNHCSRTFSDKLPGKDLNPRKHRQKWSRHILSRQKTEFGAGESARRPCSWRTCRRKRLLGGQLLLCLIQHLATWADPKLQASETSICRVGFCIHGNAYFTYHFISNNGKLNTGCEAMSGFRLDGGGGG